MRLPFTSEQFLSVFGLYNQAVWPAQIFFNLLGLVVIFLAIKKYFFSDRVITFTLSFFWFWIGIVYHFIFFTAINPAAYAFALLNIIQGSLFVVYGMIPKRLSFNFKPNGYGITGTVLIFYALVIYPLLGYILGHIYPESPTFGLPCPTTIFTLGLLLWTAKPLPKTLLIIPFLWSLIGFSAAWTLGITEDTGLLIAGIIGTVLVIVRDRKVSGSGTEI